MDLSLAQAFREFATRPGSELEGALLVSQVVRPTTDVDWCHRELQRLADLAGHGLPPADLVQFLRDQGFAGADQYAEPDNSALDFVLRERRGIPISLAMVVLGVARRIGVPAMGINFPGHFLVTLGAQLADPFTLAMIDNNEGRQRIAAAGLPPTEALKPATPIDITLRMLNNLRGLALARGDHAGAMVLTDYQLIIAPNAYAIRLARIELWHAMGATSMIQRELEQAIALAPSNAAKAELQKAQRHLAGSVRPTLH